MADTEPLESAETRRTRTATAAAAPRAESLEAQVAQLQTDIKSITETLKRMAGDRIDAAQSSARTRAEDAIAGVQGEFETVERQLKDTIREKPLTAVGAALAIGYLIAALTR